MQLLKEETRQSLRIFRSDRIFIWSARISLIVLFLGFFILTLSWQKLPPLIPFYYSLPWGEEQLATPATLIIFLSAVSLLVFINMIGAFFLYKKSAYLSHFLLYASSALSVVSIITIVQIIILVT